MSYQQCALYGDLVLWLRDQAARLLAGDDGDIQKETERLDRFIRDWFFAPQDNLHGLAPRDLIYAEELGKPNPIDPSMIDEFLLDDCPICQAEREEFHKALEAGEDPGFHWTYDDGGYPLIARYDPEGYEAMCDEMEAIWAKDRARRQAQDGDADIDPSAEGFSGDDDLPEDIPF